jgi:hypothetical protein
MYLNMLFARDVHECTLSKKNPSIPPKPGNQLGRRKKDRAREIQKKSDKYPLIMTPKYSLTFLNYTTACHNNDPPSQNILHDGSLYHQRPFLSFSLDATGIFS